jgi:acetyltransferase-like isoleucine patch superfamily enzyme
MTLGGVRGRVQRTVKRRVQYWANGPEIVYPGDHGYVDVPRSTWFEAGIVHFHTEDGGPVSVGKYSGIHHTVTVFVGGIHHTEWVGLLHVQRDDRGNWRVPPDSLKTRGPVVFGNDCWVTYGAVVMSGVTIGDGAVVGACSVVAKSVEPYEIVAGNPARHVGWRFDEPTRQALLRIRWWDWPDEKVERLRAEIDSPDVAGFIARHDPLATPIEPVA